MSEEEHTFEMTDAGIRLLLKEMIAEAQKDLDQKQVKMLCVLLSSFVTNTKSNPTGGSSS